ncbi:MAG: DNA adenine methylase [Clostridia bacterium]|nr:DNA adenine methylase [Clostridia bacterium]
MDYIKSPLNYTGNKYRILSQIQSYFPSKIKVMVDLFCGGATVGLNTECEQTIFIDNDPHVIGLLKFLSQSQFSSLLGKLEKIILEFNLSYSSKYGYAFYKQYLENDNPNNGLKQYNSKGFYALRDQYNCLENKNTERANLMLYLLLVYGFNNDMRFSKEGKFNLPVGKTDLNNNNIAKLKEFIQRTQQISCQFVCGDFKSTKIQSIIKSADFIYMDPPYLITNAVYNESGKWNEQNEYEIFHNTYAAFHPLGHI